MARGSDERELFMQWWKICDAMRAQRLHLGMTQQDVADKLECTVQFVSRTETGVRMPNLRTLLRFANVLEMDLVPTPETPEVSKSREIGAGTPNAPGR